MIHPPFLFLFTLKKKDTYPPIRAKLVLKRNEAPTSQPKLRRIGVILFGFCLEPGKMEENRIKNSLRLFGS